ncbi:hypothetical protein [Priestia aryabhattai]|uniref:hypothetical protein n=1 Tax=Priestia aryabhattai TaxID=412384 RepID=UPI00064E3F07|nr:hypothetical protein [Priestia aryabhattai]KML24637.1 hypothetical protein VL11_25605 [Priestia aryabhattai]KMN93405.1 hypothetical protein ABV89_25585 [Priestia aryabhattai]
MKYFEQAKEIWTKYVPKNGQSDIVEGELIRAIEKLRWEAQSNGNGNWDEGFEMLASYILEILNDNDVFKLDTLSEIQSDVNTLLTSEYEPYLEDDLYDRLADRVIEWHFAKKGPIKRTINQNLYR